MVRIGGVRAVTAAAVAMVSTWALVSAAVASTDVSWRDASASAVAPEPATTTTFTTTPASSHVPIRVGVDRFITGPGTVVELEGTGPVTDGVVAGPVEIWVAGEDDPVLTEISTEHWTYPWYVDGLRSYQLTVWCGTPTASEVYPDDLVVRIDAVIMPCPPTTTTIPVVAQDPPIPVPAVPAGESSETETAGLPETM